MNNDMKKFLNKILLLPVVMILSLVFWIPFGIFVIGNQYQENYNASLVDKVSRLKSINDPKIILVGNSNLAFGMTSQMLQDAFNMPVVNLGLHGGLGNAFHEGIAKLNINSDDLVILFHTNFSDDDKINNTSLAWITIEYNWDLYKILREKDYFSMMIAYPGYWLRGFWSRLYEYINITPEKISSYNRRAFNEFGDVFIKPTENKKTVEELLKSAKITLPEINNTCINRLNEYNKYIRERGATLLVAGYPIADGEFTPPREEYEKFQRELASKLDCEIISDYRDYFIPYKYFYDTVLHLDAEGTKIRTLQLIRDIQNWQKKTENH